MLKIEHNCKDCSHNQLCDLKKEYERYQSIIRMNQIMKLNSSNDFEVAFLCRHFSSNSNSSFNGTN